MIGQAQTGSGKTAAFGLPMIEHVDPGEPEVQALVLTPTRELCIQVTQALRAYAQRKGIDVVAVFGGAPIRSQQAQLRDGGQIVVGTVGRVLDLIQRASLILHSCRYVVLDEADEMLDLGFLEDVERILALTPNSRQTALFSATMPPPIRALADRYLYDPVTVKVKSATLTVDSVEQFSVDVKSGDKAEKLVDVLRAERPDQAIVFTRTKIRCDQLYRTPARPRHERQGAARRHVPGPARRRDARVQGRPAADPRRHRRRRPRPRHLDGHPRRQLRRARRARRLRAPHRAHRPRRPLGPRHHLRRAAPAARARGDRAAHRHRDHAVGRGRARRGPRRWPSARAGTPSRICRATATSRRPSWSPASAAPRASRSPTSSTP